MRDVTLTQVVYDAAVNVGRERFRESVKHAMKDTRGKDEERSHVLGAIGEAVVAEALGVEWTRSINTFKAQLDVAGYEVRTRSTVNGELIIRKNDPDERTYVLVVPTREKLRFSIVGMLPAALAKERRWWRTDRGEPHAWFVPQSALIPFYVSG